MHPEIKKPAFIKSVIVMLVIISVILRYININFDAPSVNELCRTSYNDIIALIIVCLSLWWLLEDTFSKEYKYGKDIFIMQLLLLGISFISIGSLYVMFGNNAAFLIKLSDELIRRGYSGDIGGIYRLFLWSQFWAAAGLLLYALWMSNKKSEIYYGIVYQSAGTMGLASAINYTLSQVDLQDYG